MSKELTEGHIGAVVRSLRAIRKISQDLLAERSGLSRGTISNVENDVGVPGLDVVIKLASGLGVNASVFLPPTPATQAPPGWQTLARRLQLSYEEAMSLRTLLAARGTEETATTEEALLVWMHAQKVLP